MEVLVDGFGAVYRLEEVTGLASVYTKTYMAERVLLRKSGSSFCNGLAVGRQDGMFYEIMLDGFGAVC